MTASFTRLTLFYGVIAESFKPSEYITSDQSKTACCMAHLKCNKYLNCDEQEEDET
jgi:hypothetical protein